jgi:hypothetical protein
MMRLNVSAAFKSPAKGYFIGILQIPAYWQAAS